MKEQILSKLLALLISIIISGTFGLLNKEIPNDHCNETEIEFLYEEGMPRSGEILNN
jgi:hypothetical protein